MKKLVTITLIFLLFYTRFVNLSWGFPYPMHPDERNMAVAIQQMSCGDLRSANFELKNCFNPHFFAYGQLPLYLAYGGVQFFHILNGQVGGQPTFLEASLALRIISTISSILLVFVLLKIIELVLKHNKKHFDFQTLRLLTLIFLIFQPYMIQFSRFGTTESLLMLFYSLIIYYSLKLMCGTTIVAPYRTIFLLGFFSGLALGTKTSSILFLGVPIIALFFKILSFRTHIFRSFVLLFSSLFVFIFVSLFAFLLSSPHSVLNWNDFLGSMNYESAVGLGTFIPFYTRQFVGTTPILFQFQKILPYILGLPQLILSILGVIFLPSTGWIIIKLLWQLILQVARVKGTRQHAQTTTPIRHLVSLEYWRGKLRVTESAKLYDALRFALLLSFLPSSFFFAKWTRFIAPSFPLFSLFAILFLLHFAQKYRAIIWGGVIISVIPGIAFLSIYLSPDVRFTASDWIYKNIPANSKILSETANVIDIPIPTSDTQKIHPYQLISFNFYDLDVNPQLQTAFSEALKQADYIFVPSRRIYKNHDMAHYPLLNKYYSDLFSGKSGFEKVAEFSSFPKLGPWAFPDENAEETWTVFDHPVIRIYKRSHKSESLKVLKSEGQKQQTNLDFSDYKTTNYALRTTNYELLVADTPEKWERGLMYVRNKEDIGGLDGMIFTFPDSQKRTFWNKNTLSHLTLYWIHKGKIIGVSDLPSITETKEVFTVSSPSKADTVVEVFR